VTTSLPVVAAGVALHVVELDGLRPQRRTYERDLSSDERARSARLRSGPDRERFVLRRGALRRLLAEEVAVSPARLRFTAGPHGKPRLEGAGPCFSASSSGSLFVVAISYAGEVGVDVERVVPRSDLDAMARDHFPRIVRARFAALGEGERLAAFYRIWTIEEAVSKLDGRGIADGMPVADVSIPAMKGGGRWDLSGVATHGRCSVSTIGLGDDAVISLATGPLGTASA
jgi:4'-phosphopantetheinyl transferase